MRITASARRHGFTDHEIAHAFEHAIRYVEYEYDGEDRLLVIGATPTGELLELVAVPADGPTVLIHADRLRPKFHEFLR